MLEFKFSNFIPYESEHFLHGIKIRTPEHFYQSQKTSSIEEQIKVLEAPTPGKAKRLSELTLSKT